MSKICEIMNGTGFGTGFGTLRGIAPPFLDGRKGGAVKRKISGSHTSAFSFYRSVRLSDERERPI